MYRESMPRYSYQVEDYESLWFRLLGELAHRRVWSQDELAALIERLESEARPYDLGPLGTAISDEDVA